MFTEEKVIGIQRKWKEQEEKNTADRQPAVLITRDPIGKSGY